MALDLTSFNAILKEHYSKDRVQDATYRDNPLLALLPKAEDMGGRNFPVPIVYGNPANRSASIAQALAGTTSTKVTEFLMTRVKDYAAVSIDAEAMLASKGNENAFLEALTTEVDGGINVLTRSLAQKLYHAGWGHVGNINATVTGTTLTLVAAADITNFEVGDVLQFSLSLASDALRNSGSSVTVTAVNRSAGSMTVSGNLSTVTGLASGDFIFKKGDRQDSASPSRLAVAGLAAWLPVTAPDSTSFFGVDRSVDVVRLGGNRYSAAGLPIEEALLNAAAAAGREGAKLTHYFMNFDAWSSLQNSIGSKVQIIDLKATPTIGFASIQIMGPSGIIKCVADLNCPANTVYGLQLDTWKLHSIDAPVHMIEEDGLSMLRSSTLDQYDIRFRSFCQLACNKPGANVVISL